MFSICFCLFVFFLWGGGGPVAWAFATQGEWGMVVALCLWTRPKNLIVMKTLSWTSILHLEHSGDTLNFVLLDALTVWGTWLDVIFKLP